jgi:hypothetical protein
VGVDRFSGNSGLLSSAGIERFFGRSFFGAQLPVGTITLPDRVLRKRSFKGFGRANAN